MKQLQYELADPLFKAILKHKEDRTIMKLVSIKRTKDIDRKLKELEEGISRNITPEYLQNIKYIKTPEGHDLEFKHFYEQIDKLNAIYHNQIIYNTGGLHVADLRYQLWGLQRNYILDANGGFNYLYKSNKSMFVIARQSKVFSYENTTIHVCKKNSTQTQIKKYTNYFEEIAKSVVRDYQEGDKILIIYRKKQDQIIKALNGVGLEVDDKKISLAYFGNITGRNDWRDYNKCYILVTPNIQFYNYPLYYQWYGRKQIHHATSLKLGKNSDNQTVFRNGEYEQVRRSSVTGELYQAMKRINRDLDKAADVYLIINDSEIIDELEKQLKDVKIAYDYDLDLIEAEKIYNNELRYKKSQKYKLHKAIKLKLKELVEKGPGEYSKKQFREDLGIMTSKKFTNLFTDEEMIEFLQIYPMIDMKNNIQKITIMDY